MKKEYEEVFSKNRPDLEALRLKEFYHGGSSTYQWPHVFMHAYQNERARYESELIETLDEDVDMGVFYIRMCTDKFFYERQAQYSPEHQMTATLLDALKENKRMTHISFLPVVFPTGAHLKHLQDKQLISTNARRVRPNHQAVLDYAKEVLWTHPVPGLQGLFSRETLVDVSGNSDDIRSTTENILDDNSVDSRQVVLLAHFFSRIQGYIVELLESNHHIKQMTVQGIKIENLLMLKNGHRLFAPLLPEEVHSVSSKAPAGMRIAALLNRNRSANLALKATESASTTASNVRLFKGC